MLILLTSFIVAAAPAADCAAYEPVRKRFAEMQQAIANGASPNDLTGPDLIGPLRTCFRTQVMPHLTRGERNDQVVDAAVGAFFAWGRQAALLGAEDELAPEFAQGTASVEKGVSHAYAVARDRCIKLNDETQVTRMLGLLRFSQLLGFQIASARDDDLEACIRGRAYLVRVTMRSESTKRGLGSEYTYEAVLGRAPGGEAGELVGKGSYSGFLIARNANCWNGAPDPPLRITVSGKLEASGSLVDMAEPGATPDPHLLYALETTDWDVRPLWGADGPYAQTSEEREDLAGFGTTTSLEPVKLTGRIASATSTTKSQENNCAGVTTRSTTVRVVQLQGRKR